MCRRSSLYPVGTYKFQIHLATVVTLRGYAGPQSYSTLTMGQTAGQQAGLDPISEEGTWRATATMVLHVIGAVCLRRSGIRKEPGDSSLSLLARLAPPLGDEVMDSRSHWSIYHSFISPSNFESTGDQYDQEIGAMNFHGNMSRRQTEEHSW